MGPLQEQPLADLATEAGPARVEGNAVRRGGIEREGPAEATAKAEIPQDEKVAARQGIGLEPERHERCCLEEIRPWPRADWIAVGEMAPADIHAGGNRHLDPPRREAR